MLRPNNETLVYMYELYYKRKNDNLLCSNLSYNLLRCPKYEFFQIGLKIFKEQKTELTIIFNWNWAELVQTVN